MAARTSPSGHANTGNPNHSFVTTRYYWSSPSRRRRTRARCTLPRKSSNLLASNFREFFWQPTKFLLRSRHKGQCGWFALGSPQGTMVFCASFLPLIGTMQFGYIGQSPYLFSLTEDGPGGENGKSSRRNQASFRTAPSSCRKLYLPHAAAFDFQT